jgi:hypothetical protein
MNSKNYYYGGDGQSDNDPVVVAYPVNPSAPPVMSNFIADTGLQPSVLRFQNEGAIFFQIERWFMEDLCESTLIKILSN